jgi:hypothetical protein
MIAEILVQPPVLIALTLAVAGSLIAILTKLLGRRTPLPVPVPVRVPDSRRPR